MKILLVNRYYGDEQTPTGRMLHDLAILLAKRGHEVTVLSSSNRYSGSTTSQDESHPKLRIKNLFLPGKSRMMNWAFFWLQTALQLPLMKWDCCVLMTDPPFLPLAAAPAGILHPKRRLFWWTMDLYPEAMVAANLISKNGLIHRVLRLVNEIGLRKMTGVIALGQNQKKRLQQYDNWKDITSFSLVVPPWDLRPLIPIERSANPVISRFNWGSKLIALYAGNLGEGHLYHELAEAAKHLHEQGRTDWLLVFACRGKGVAELVKLVADLPNVLLTDYLPPEDSVALLSAASVHLVTMKPGWEGVIVPSKLYGTLQTRAPVLFIGPADSDTALAIKSHSRGTCLPPGSSGESVVKALDELHNHLLQPMLPDNGPREISDFITS
jgi:glycosyltransferase involved in cell wall biosynthesis